MKIKSLLPALGLFVLAGAILCFTHLALATSPIPASTRVRFENDKVRVIEYHTGSEKSICGFGMHTHPAHVYIMTTDAKIRVITPDRKETFDDAKAGDVGWADPEHHIAENILGNNAACYLIEIKDKDWKPSTGLSH